MTDDLVMIAAFEYRYEADSVRSLLMDASIPAVVHADDAGGAMPGMSWNRNPARVLVSEQDEARARELLADFEVEAVGEPEDDPDAAGSNDGTTDDASGSDGESDGP